MNYEYQVNNNKIEFLSNITYKYVSLHTHSYNLFMLIPYNRLPENSKVWIYQADRTFNLDEVSTIELAIEDFVENWKSHQVEVPAYGALYYRRFVVLIADNAQVNVSGCSIDSSVKLIKELEQAYQVNFFDRMKVCYKIQEQMVGSFSINQIEELLNNGKINKDTIIFNNLVANKLDFEQKWETPLSDSLLSRYLLVK